MRISCVVGLVLELRSKVAVSLCASRCLSPVDIDKKCTLHLHGTWRMISAYEDAEPEQHALFLSPGMYGHQ